MLIRAHLVDRRAIVLAIAIVEVHPHGVPTEAIPRPDRNPRQQHSRWSHRYRYRSRLALVHSLALSHLVPPLRIILPASRSGQADNYMYIESRDTGLPLRRKVAYPLASARMPYRQRTIREYQGSGNLIAPHLVPFPPRIRPPDFPVQPEIIRLTFTLQRQGVIHFETRRLDRPVPSAAQSVYGY